MSKCRSDETDRGAIVKSFSGTAPGMRRYHRRLASKPGQIGDFKTSKAYGFFERNLNCVSAATGYNLQTILEFLAKMNLVVHEWKSFYDRWLWPRSKGGNCHKAVLVRGILSEGALSQSCRSETSVVDNG